MEACNGYWDKDDLFKGNFDGYPSTNNGMQLTSIYYLIKRQLLDKIVSAESFVFSVKFKKHEHNLIGLYHERKGHPGVISYDCVIALASAAYFYEPQIAKDIYEYMIKHGFVYNNIDPDTDEFRYWHGRFMVRPHYKHCAGLKLSLWDKFVLLSFFVGKVLFSKGTSGTQNAWVVAQPMLNTSCRGIKLAIKLLNWRIKKRFGSVQGLMAVYHGSVHPFPKFVKY